MDKDMLTAMAQRMAERGKFPKIKGNVPKSIRERRRSEGVEEPSVAKLDVKKINERRSFRNMIQGTPKRTDKQESTKQAPTAMQQISPAGADPPAHHREG
jgi:hypothetical protein